MITVQEFKELFPRCRYPEKFAPALEKILPKYGIDTPQRIAAFIAQCGHESGGWKTMVENLNYSAKALNMVFPKYFKRAGRDATVYARHPEMIANVVYANRMGNGSTESGDGWKYRGRGPIQLTGFNNYKSFSVDMRNDAVKNPDIVSTKIDQAIMSAIWFWTVNSLNDYADKEDIKGMTRRINGGYIGLAERVEMYKHVLRCLGSDSDIDQRDTDDSVDFEPFSTLRRGSRGEGVKILQKELGITPADGIFGKGTEKAVREWQAANGLHVDGIVGPKTLGELLDD